jgi:hypothetical protein
MAVSRIDPASTWGSIALVLPDTDSAPTPKRRRKFRRWIFIAVIIGGLLWLNGPGLRLLAPPLASYFLEKSGLRGSFTIRGSLSHGIRIADLQLEGDRELASLSIGEIKPHYRWRNLIIGQLDGLSVHHLHADIRLGLPPKASTPPAEKSPLDLQKITETLRTVQQKILPLALDLQDISLNATRAGKPVLTLASSSLSHLSGQSAFSLQLGIFTDATGRAWPAQQSTITWDSTALLIDRIDPLPGLTISALALQLPQHAPPSLAAQIQLDTAHFTLSSSPGLSAVEITLRQGELPLAPVAQRFGTTLPVNGTLSALAIKLDQLLPNPSSATGTAQILLKNLSYQADQIPELSLSAALTASDTTLSASGQVLNSDFRIEATAPVTRTASSFTLGDASGRFTLADVPAVLRALAPRVPAIDAAADIPAASFTTDFQLQLLANRLKSARAQLLLKPQDPALATPISLAATWAPDAPATGLLTLDGLKASATYDLAQSSYQASLDLEEFTSARLAPWLAIAKIIPPGTANLTGKWAGRGALKSATHQGSLTLSQAAWSRPEASPIDGSGSITYDWPTGVNASALQLRMADQSVSLDANLADDHLTLSQLLWTAGGEELLGGTARFPMPKNFSKWREMIAHDLRPIELSIRSQVLPLSRLSGWIPSLRQLDASATGQLDLQASGTYAAPVLDVKILAKDLHSATQPKLPPAAVQVLMTARDGHLKLDATATAADFSPATLTSTLPFRPAAWADQPELIKSETIAARIDLPQLDLSRFATLIPAAEKISGSLTGNVLITGQLGKPVVKGSLALSQANVKLKSPQIPAIQAINAAVEFGLDRIALKSLKATVAGGSITGEGALTLTGAVPTLLDVRLRADHLPLLRNDFLILRANADLRLQGPFQRATLSGTVGTVDGIFYRDIELLPIGTPFTGPSAAALPKIDAPSNQVTGLPEPFRSWLLNVQVRTEQPFLVRGNLANGQITGKLRIGGTLAAPAPDGAFTIKDFTAALPFTTLAVKTGTISFTPAAGFDPILEIRGLAEPRPYRITVYAYGRASNPQLVLTSNPPLPENEIMTLLATGTTTSGLEDPQAASSRAMQLLAEELRRGRFRYGKQLRPLLQSLDRIDFSIAEADPYSTDSYSTATLAITDRWFLSAGVSSTGDSRGMAIWRFSFR